MTTQTINLEMIPKGIPPIIHVSQYDKGQTWNFNLLLNGQAFTVPAGSNVTIQGTKPDQTGFQYACTFSGSVVTAEEEEQMTILPGDTKAEIVIGNSGDIIASINIIIRVEPAALSDDTQISETDLPLIQEAAQAAEVVPGLVEDAEAWANGTRGGSPVGPTDPTYEKSAKYYAEMASEVSSHPPYIGANGNWYIWDDQTEQFVDSGAPSQGAPGADGADGADGITPSISATATVDANVGTPGVTVTKSGTDAEPSFAFNFSNLKGNQGDQGATGNGIQSIAKTGTSGLVDTYTITFTNGTTTTFTVTNGQDGSGSGDMLKADYDGDSAVKNSGGIKAWVQSLGYITGLAWSALTGKPFSSVGSGLSVSSDALTADVRSVNLARFGTASETVTSYQKLQVNGSAVGAVITGSMYLQSSTKTTADGVDTFTFTNSNITSSADYDVSANVFGVAPTEMVQSSTTMQVKFKSSDNVTSCRLYIK